MKRGPLTSGEVVALDDISKLADAIYAKATGLDKHPRHTISDAAKLIQWICYECQHPGDAEAVTAIAELRTALNGYGQSAREK